MVGAGQRTTIRRLGAVIGAGPKGVGLLVALQRRLPGAFAAVESRGVVASWDSTYAGTSRTRTGLDYSDTLESSTAVPWSLREFSRRHPMMTETMMAENDLPKEVLQDYYRVACDLSGVELNLGRTVESIEVLEDGFRLECRYVEYVVKYLIVATGPVRHKTWPHWAQKLDPSVCAHSIGHGTMNRVRGRHVVIVGGGHATPDIACRMWELGAKVTAIVRKPELKVNYLPYLDEFIAPETWPRFARLSVEEKYAIVARVYEEGPWLTPQSHREFYEALAASEPTDRPIVLRLGTKVNGARPDGDGVVLEFGDGSVERFDFVICATGFQPDVRELPFASSAIWEGRCHAGLPIIEDDYSLRGVPRLFFAGHLATLGPRGVVEAILHYSQHASRRIVDAIVTREGTRNVSDPG